GDFGGGEHYSNAFSGSFVVHFSGTDFQWIGKMGPNFGIASLFMDGQSVGTVDAYSPTVLYQQVLYSASGLPDGVHAFQAKIGDYPSPARNPSSSDCYQVMDGFTTSGTPLSLPMISPQDPSVTKSGTWTFGPNILSGAYCWSNDRSTPGSLTFPFNGTGVEVYGHPEGEDGMMDVYIDGGYVTTVDEFNPLYDSILSDSTNDSLLYVATGLSAGDHTIQLVVAQTNNPNSLDFYTQIDGFIALPAGGTTTSGGGSLSGSSAGADPNGYDLTALGTSDWTHWGRGGTFGNFDDKASGGGQISDVAQVGAGSNVGGWADPSRTVTWSDGTPTPSGTDDGYIWSNGSLGSGYSFTVPAGTAPQTLLVFYGASTATATIQAHLSDGSAPDYTNSNTGPGAWLETLTFQAASDGQVLTVTLLKTGNNAGFTDGSADLVAAMLQSGSGGGGGGAGGGGGSGAPGTASLSAASAKPSSSGGSHCGSVGVDLLGPLGILLLLREVLRRAKGGRSGDEATGRSSTE
ncbi:MAG TPA: hypothetical protein VG457_08365, partial [Planctomycetota bacterium]|nr:hypothetical protein [Planctomycetota bacterium]